MATKDAKAQAPAGEASAAGDDGAAGLEGAPDAGAAPEQFQPKRLTDIVSDLWHQKPGTRAPRAGAADRALSAKEVVNGLDGKELTLGTALMVLDLALTIIVFFLWHGSSQAKFRHYAPDFLVAGLVGAGILGLGVGLRRRALLGFAAFIVGMELISFGLVYGILYLFFGGWLIVRVMRKQRQDQAVGKYKGTVDTGPKGRRGSAAASTPKAPSASKRYTPPRRTKAAAKKR